jgi:hypothetical protein
MADRPKVLFVTYGGGHVKMLLPVIRELERRGSMEVKVIGLTTAATVLADANIHSLGFHELVGEDDSQAMSWGAELLAGNASPLVDERESVAYLGLSFADLVTEHGLAHAKELLQQRGRGAFLPVSSMRRFLERLKPDVVVTSNSPRAEQACVIAAAQMGIPSLCVVDLFAIEEISYMGKEGYGQKICVLNEYVQKRFLDAGRSRHEILVTGNPAFDALSHESVRQAGVKIRARPGFAGKKLVLWVSQPEPAKHRMTGVEGDPRLPFHICEKLLEICRKYPQWALIVRPHPSEELATFKPDPGMVIAPQSEPLQPLLAAADVVVCMTSTVGYEAALLGKTLIHLPLSIYRNEADYTEMGLAYQVNRLDDLELALKSVLLQGWKPPVSLRVVGGATRAVADAVEGMSPE